MIATVLAQREDGASARAAKWRQLVDLVAQRGAGKTSDEALAWLRANRGEVPFATRRGVAAALGGRAVSPAALRLFAEDEPQVAAPLFASARMANDEWIALLPALGPTGRAFLRHRRDLGQEVERALASFGAADFALSGSVAEAAASGSP